MKDLHVSNTEFKPDDIIKISAGDSVTLGRVVDSTPEEVLVFRADGDIWYKLNEYQIENLGSCRV